MKYIGQSSIYNRSNRTQNRGILASAATELVSTSLELSPSSRSFCIALAPMAGITDAPFRNLCENFGASWSCSEMLTSDVRLWSSKKSTTRLNFESARGCKVIQIVGNDAKKMAEAAKICEQIGAQAIDINMGCPAKKVAKKACGSALLKDEKLVANILHSVVNAVNLPVTLKFRTGCHPEQRNATAIAYIAQSAGIAQLVLHGRTRACAFKGPVEYETIAAVVDAVDIPVIANGDIKNAQTAKYVLDKTGCAGIMIGRAAQGRPWIFNEIQHFLKTGEPAAPIDAALFKATVLGHISEIQRFYGVPMGVRLARKHFKWYASQLTDDLKVSKFFNQLECPDQQLVYLDTFLSTDFLQESFPKASFFQVSSKEALKYPLMQYSA